MMPTKGTHPDRKKEVTKMSISTYSIQRMSWGYIVCKELFTGSKFYVASYYNGHYRLTRDPTYAKGFASKKTAEKHIDRLMKEEE